MKIYLRIKEFIRMVKVGYPVSLGWCVSGVIAKAEGKINMIVTADLEHIEQARFVSWFRQEHPDVVIFAIPNGGKRNKVVAAKLKAEGVLSGVPDLFIPEWKVFVEMKRKKGGTVSKEQKDLMEYLQNHRYTCRVCNGFEEAKEFILNLGC